MTKNELVVLGLLNRKPMHGYQLHHEIVKTGMEYWAQVNLSSIYNTLNRLKRKGMVEAKREKPGKMPARSVYHLTKSGKEKLAFLVEQTLRDDRMHPHNLVLGVAFIRGLVKREALSCLEVKREGMQKLLKRMTEVDRQQRGNVPLPLGFVIQSALDHLKLGIKEISGLIRQIQKMPVWK
jgi:DNA-binding PadR family transcriptional regulator